MSMTRPALLLLCMLWPGSAVAQEPLRARALGVQPGTLPPGPLNAITDVAGVRVGQTTVRVGDSVRTGVTAILPHGGNPFLERVPAAIYVGNGFGKLLGVTQVAELGELETPVLLTCTLCVWKAADALVGWMLAQPGMAEVRSINPVVGETNDGYVLNAIRSRPITDKYPAPICTCAGFSSGCSKTRGSHTSGSGNSKGNRNVEGRIPTTVVLFPSRTRVLPRMLASPEKWLCQKPSLRSATFGPPGCCSWLRKSRPRSGSTPSTWKNS